MAPGSKHQGASVASGSSKRRRISEDEDCSGGAVAEAHNVKVDDADQDDEVGGGAPRRSGRSHHPPKPVYQIEDSRLRGDDSDSQQQSDADDSPFAGQRRGRATKLQAVRSPPQQRKRERELAADRRGGRTVSGGSKAGGSIKPAVAATANTTQHGQASARSHRAVRGKAGQLSPQGSGEDEEAGEEEEEEEEGEGEDDEVEDCPVVLQPGEVGAGGPEIGARKPKRPTELDQLLAGGSQLVLPSSRRSLLQPKAAEEAGTSSTQEGSSDGEASDADGGEDGDEGEQENEAEEEEEEEEDEPERKQYTLRDRSRMVPVSLRNQLNQRKQEQLRAQHRKLRLESRRSRYYQPSGNYRDGGRRRNARSRNNDSDDELDDVDGGVDGWRNVLNMSRNGRNGVGGPLTPVGAAGVGQLVPGSGAGGRGAAAWDRDADSDLDTPHTAANAEITPVQVDPNVSFDEVGGMESHIRALKEMIFLPIVYPELFERFRIAPPRGVLFYGPPGTGKTLVARALAAHASKAGKKVAFFMRKGADILSKWVGEAERQLRLLFEEAARQQPSIIFFDEIDGLAPVRSSKQDQIHNSIVSTLLALMDGLDSRGGVVVIGATNRIDSVDGALRRPGRFDRELLFPLPSLQARRSILDIHTRKWAEPPSEELREDLAALAVGYCGADCKALCAEAALHALRRRYPQIYDSEEKLLVVPSTIRVEREDFMSAYACITPASHRSASTHARPLPPSIAPALATTLTSLLTRLSSSYPPAAACLAAAAASKRSVAHQQPQSTSGPSGAPADHLKVLPPEMVSQLQPKLPASFMQKPRLLLCGPDSNGQTHLAAALLHALEGLPIHPVGLPSLLADPGARSLEEALVHVVIEARRASPALLFLPHLQLWWQTATSSLRATLWMLLSDIPADVPLLLLATADCLLDELEDEVLQLFGGYMPGSSTGAAGTSSTADGSRTEAQNGLGSDTDSIVILGPPPAAARRAMFSDVVLGAAQPAAQQPSDGAGENGPCAAGTDPGAGLGSAPPALPLDPAAQEVLAQEEERRKQLQLRAAYEEDAAAQRALRVGLREVTLRLLSDRRWKMFARPPSPTDDPKYWSRVSYPMDLATLLAHVDGRLYSSPDTYLADVALIVQGAQEYFAAEAAESVDGEGVGAGAGAREVSRACALADEAAHLVQRQIPLDLVLRCEAIIAKGGPAPPPAGMQVPPPPPHFMPASPRSYMARRQAQAGADGGHKPQLGSQPGKRQNKSKRESTRLKGVVVEKAVMFEDPEAAARRLRKALAASQNQAQSLIASQPDAEAELGAAADPDAGAARINGVGDEAAAGAMADIDGGADDGGAVQGNGNVHGESDHVAAETPIPGTVDAAATAGSAAGVGTMQGCSAENADVEMEDATAATAVKAAAAGAATNCSDTDPQLQSSRDILDGNDGDAGYTPNEASTLAPGAITDGQHLGSAADIADIPRPAATTTAAAEAPEPVRLPDPDPQAVAAAEAVLAALVHGTDGWVLDRLEGMRGRLAQVVQALQYVEDRCAVVQQLLHVVSTEVAPTVDR